MATQATPPKGTPTNMNGLMNCPHCGIDRAAHQQLIWSKKSVDFDNHRLQSQLRETQYTIECYVIRSKIFEEREVEVKSLEVDVKSLEQQLGNWQSAYSEQRTQLENVTRRLALTEQALENEKAAHHVTAKSLEGQQNSTQDIIAFLDTLGFPRASNPSENVSIGTIWQDNKKPRHKGR